MDKERTVVLCVGNPARGDDAAGALAAPHLRANLPEGVDLAELGGEPADLLERLKGAGRAYILDACVSGGAAGGVTRFDVASAPLPAHGFSLSSHGLGLADALELARALGVLPPTCVVFAIEGAAFDPGGAPTKGVTSRARRAAELVLQELGAGSERRESSHA